MWPVTLRAVSPRPSGWNTSSLPSQWQVFWQEIAWRRAIDYPSYHQLVTFIRDQGLSPFPGG